MDSSALRSLNKVQIALSSEERWIGRLERVLDLLVSESDVGRTASSAAGRAKRDVTPNKPSDWKGTCSLLYQAQIRYKPTCRIADARPAHPHAFLKVQRPLSTSFLAAGRSSRSLWLIVPTAPWEKREQSSAIVPFPKRESPACSSEYSSAHSLR